MKKFGIKWNTKAKTKYLPRTNFLIKGYNNKHKVR